MPRRIQRKRVKGWRMPSNAVYVGRPTKYGNEFEVGVDGTAAQCVEYFEEMLLKWQRNRPVEFNVYIAPLAGKDLACWCKEDAPCHADVLLQLANN